MKKLIYALFSAGLCVISPASASVLFVDAYKRDKIVFDVGAAFGRDAAVVPISGSALPGSTIDVRLWNSNTGVGTGWVSAGTAGVDGRLTGAVTAGASPEWLRAEARIASIPSIFARSTNEIGTGDVVAYMGQSELDRIALPFHDKAPPVSIGTTNQVQSTPFAGGNPVFLSDGSSPTSGLSSFAKFWIDNAPSGRKLHLVGLAKSGASRLAVASDAATNFKWSEWQSTVDSVKADGTHIGLVVESWSAGDSAVGQNWKKTFTPFYTGVTAAGDKFKIGQNFDLGPNNNKTIPVDHILWDVTGNGRGLFDVNKTKLAQAGPHRYELQAHEPHINAITRKGGGIDFYARSIERSRLGIQDWATNQDVASILVDELTPVSLDYRNGVLGNNGNWTDISHPSSNSADGLQRIAKHLANASLHALDHLDYDVPLFDQVLWTVDFVEVWSSVGPITTARIERGLAPLDDSYAH